MLSSAPLSHHCSVTEDVKDDDEGWGYSDFENEGYDDAAPTATAVFEGDDYDVDK